MLYEAIDHISYLPVDHQLATRAAERIGWKRLPCPEGHAISFGGPSNLFQIWDRSPTHANGGGVEYGIRVANLQGTVATLQSRGIAAQLDQWEDEAGNVVADVAFLDTLQQAGVGLRLVEWKQPTEVRHAKIAELGGFEAKVPVKRLDHFAIITHDLDVKSLYWDNVLGIPRFGELSTSTLIIRQYKVGDAIIELLGPADANSPLWQRDPCPAPMFSIELADLDVAVAFASHAGFTAPAAALGALPGTKTSTIPLAETGGLNWQLLQYV